MSQDVRDVMGAAPAVSDGEQACTWCGRGLPPEERGRRVCDRCVRLLRGAGLADEEIFATPREG